MSTIIDGIKGFFSKGGKMEEMYFGQLVAEAYYKLLAIETCASLIANTLLTCEFKTFEKGKEIRKDFYYMLNVRPNQNQSAAVFWHELVSKMYKENEVLVVQLETGFHIADTFNVEERVMYENIYSGIQIGSFILKESKRSSDVLHFKLNNTDVAKLIDNMYVGYGRLLAAAQSNYKRKNTPRLIIDISSTYTQDKGKIDAVKDLFEKQFKSFFEADGAGAIAPLYNGMSLNKNYNPGNNNAIHTTRDIRAIVDDIFDFAAIAYHIPTKLVRGDMVNMEQLADTFVMFGVKPPVEIIKDEINAKLYKKRDYLERTYMKIDTSKITMPDITKLANAADKLFAAGVNTINDNLQMLDREPVSDEIADMRHVTKNYEEASKLLEGGGNSDGNKKDQ